MHRETSENWRVARLASVTGCSRSAFTGRFLNATRITPLRYLTELRLAVRRIVNNDEAVEAVASHPDDGSIAVQPCL